MKLSMLTNSSLIKSLNSFVFIVFLTSVNIANASSTIVKIEDMGLSNWTVIEQATPGFGSSGPVTLDWNPFDDWFKELIAYNTGYSGKGAAFCWHGENCALKLSISDDNSILKLDSFFLGYFGMGGNYVEYNVFDLETDSSILSGTPWVGDNGLDIIVNSTSNKGFLILFGPDGYNGGINDIAYSYRPAISDIQPVPIPASAWLFVSGLAGLRLFSCRLRLA